MLLLMMNSSRARPTPCVGQLAKVKSQLRVADVHGDLGFDLGHGAALHFGDFGFQQAVVDIASVALSAAHRY